MVSITGATLEGFRLGEEVAIAMLQDLVNTYTENFTGFHLTRLDGTTVAINGDAK